MMYLVFGLFWPAIRSKDLSDWHMLPEHSIYFQIWGCDFMYVGGYPSLSFVPTLQYRPVISCWALFAAPLIYD